MTINFYKHLSIIEISKDLEQYFYVTNTQKTSSIHVLEHNVFYKFQSVYNLDHSMEQLFSKWLMILFFEQRQQIKCS